MSDILIYQNVNSLEDVVETKTEENATDSFPIIEELISDILTLHRFV